MSVFSLHVCIHVLVGKYVWRNRHRNWHLIGLIVHLIGYMYIVRNVHKVILKERLGGRVIKAFASQSGDRGFESRPRHTKAVKLVLVLSSPDAQH